MNNLHTQETRQHHRHQQHATGLKHMGSSNQGPRNWLGLEVERVLARMGLMASLTESNGKGDMPLGRECT